MEGQEEGEGGRGQRRIILKNYFATMTPDPIYRVFAKSC